MSNIEKDNSESKGTIFLYNTMFGRCILKILVNPLISKMVGSYMNTKLSTIHIRNFIKKSNINMSQYEQRKYKSFNDFFTRKIKEENRKFTMESNYLPSPCDARLTVYSISKDSYFSIKGSKYTIKDLLRSEQLSNKYNDGLIMIFRLCVDDYHRYCYIDNGKKEGNVYIKGKLHTVRPIALERYNIYKENCREYTILHTDNFGDVCQIEVGAMMVGKIKNHHEEYKFKKSEEKGMFEFGGSTIVLLFEKNKIIVKNQLLDNSNRQQETRVAMGQKIGESFK